MLMRTTIHLLSARDCLAIRLLLSHDDRSRVTEPAYRGRPWMRGSVLVDGFVAATWRADTKEGAATLRIGAYRDLSEPELSEVEAEATRLLAFLATDTAERRLAFVDLDAA
jgi:hypothetical protein